MYISPYRPDDPRMVANFKLCPLRQTLEVINPTDFQLDLPTSFGSTGVEIGGLPLTFQTTPSTTSSTNVLLVIRVILGDFAKCQNKSL